MARDSRLVQWIVLLSVLSVVASVVFSTWDEYERSESSGTWRAPSSGSSRGLFSRSKSEAKIYENARIVLDYISEDIVNARIVTEDTELYLRLNEASPFGVNELGQETMLAGPYTGGARIFVRPLRPPELNRPATPPIKLELFDELGSLIATPLPPPKIGVHCPPASAGDWCARFDTYLLLARWKMLKPEASLSDRTSRLLKDLQHDP